jgi:hypothetical protein
MSINTVRYDQFKPQNLKFSDPEPCEAKGPGGATIVYFRIKFNYEYEITKADGSIGTVTGPLYIRGPRESSKGPSVKNMEKSGKMQEQWSIMTQYDLKNPAHLAFVNRDTRNGQEAGTIHKLVMTCAEHVFKNKKKVGLNDCEDIRDTFKKFHYPLLWDLDGGYPTGKNPAGFWKLFRYTSKAGKPIQSSFMLEDQELAWDHLDGAQIDHIPVFKVENITIAGGKPTVKVELASSAVLSIKDRSAVNLLGDIDNDLTAEEKEERRKAKEKYASSASTNVAKPVSPKTTSGLIAAIPPVDGTPLQTQQNLSKPVDIDAPITNNLAALSVAETKPAVASSFSLPSDILPMPKSEPNAALNAMASSTAGTLPLPVLPNISLPF